LNDDRPIGLLSATSLDFNDILKVVHKVVAPRQLIMTVGCVRSAIFGYCSEIMSETMQNTIKLTIVR